MKILFSTFIYILIISGIFAAYYLLLYGHVLLAFIMAIGPMATVVIIFQTNRESKKLKEELREIKFIEQMRLLEKLESKKENSEDVKKTYE